MKRYKQSQQLCFLFLFLESSNITFVQSMTVAVEGQNVTLRCKASGQPPPFINWKRADGQEIMGMWSISEGNLTLIEANVDNQGTYICEAKNDVNTVTAETNLTVVAFTAIPPALMTAPEKAWVRLDCQSNVINKVMWRCKGKELPGNCLSYSNGTLVLQNVSTSKSGQYECVASIFNTTMHTQTRVLIGNFSCSHIKAVHPDTPSGNYTVDLDGEGGEDPFVIYCDMEDKIAVGVTVFSHDSEERGHVKVCYRRGCFSRDVTYTGTGITTNQLLNPTEVTSHCEQFIMFECNNNVSFIEEKFAWWVSRNRKPMYYWGGAARRSTKCACGLNNTCEGGGGCNCKNYGPGGWQDDSGLLTDKYSLPVTQLRFGDTTNVKEGFYYSWETQVLWNCSWSSCSYFVLLKHILFYDLE